MARLGDFFVDCGEESSKGGGGGTELSDTVDLFFTTGFGECFLGIGLGDPDLGGCFFGTGLGDPACGGCFLGTGLGDPGFCGFLPPGFSVLGS